MKTRSKKLSLSIGAAMAGMLTPLILAGPEPQGWQPAKPVTTFTDAKSVGPNDAVTMQCKGCKTVLIRDVRHFGPLGKGHDEWSTVGSKHTCDECKGEITVVKGKAKDAMQHNCSKCGEGTVTCCVARVAEAPKK